MTGRRRDERARRALAVALGGAFLAHALALAVDDALFVPTGRLIAPLAPLDRDAPIPAPAPELASAIALVALDADELAALPLLAVAGPGDDAAFGAHPRPLASADLPGERAADRGGGGEGGAASWTGRRDPDQTALRAQPWNGAEVYRAPRRDDRRRAASPEAIAREAERSYGDREARRLARAGAEDASRGDADGTGAGDATLAAAPEPEPALDATRGATTPARRDGATRPTAEDARVDHGDAATDVTRKGPTGDDVAVAAASSERHPDPFDLTPSRAGGDRGEGVRGARAGDGALADGHAGAAGTAATRAAVARGRGGTSIYASRTDPYLRELMRRIDQEVRFPRDLKLDLRSGRVIAVITLAADGTIDGVGVATSSGYPGFDDELTRVLRSIRKLEPVPAALLDGKRALKVMVPYTFRNPMIR